MLNTQREIRILHENCISEYTSIVFICLSALSMQLHFWKLYHTETIVCCTNRSNMYYLLQEQSG